MRTGPPPARLAFLVHAPTAATAATAFPADEPLDDRGRAWARDGVGRVPSADRTVRAPERACRDTCDVLDLTTSVDDALRRWDLGAWAGHTFDEVAAREPDAVAAWLSDPAAAPHGGEPLAALLDRTRTWLAAAPAGRTLAVCGPAVVRAALVVVLDAPPTAFWRVDLAPLTVTDLRGGPARWTVRSTGAALVPRT